MKANRKAAGFEGPQMKSSAVALLQNMSKLGMHCSWQKC